MSRKINDLKSRVGDLKFQLRQAEDELREAEIEATPVRVGDVVKYRGKEHRVCEVDPKGWSIWLKGNPRKKNGFWSCHVRNLYNDWELA